MTCAPDPTSADDEAREAIEALRDADRHFRNAINRQRIPDPRLMQAWNAITYAVMTIDRTVPVTTRSAMDVVALAFPT